MKLIVIALFLAICTGSTLAQGNNIIADGIFRFLNTLRPNMPCGFPAAGIPPMAPIRHANKRVNLNMGEFTFTGNLMNFRVDDLDTYTVRSVNFNMLQMRMDFHFHYNSISSSGTFSGTGRAPNNCAISGSGSFAQRSNQVNMHITSFLVVVNGLLTTGPIQTRATIGSFNSNIQNFVGTIAQSQQCNRALEARMPALFVANEQNISRYIESLLRPAAEMFIRGMTLENLLEFLTNPPPPPVCRP